MKNSKNILNEDLNLIKLFMNYDSKKTLNENVDSNKLNLLLEEFDVKDFIAKHDYYLSSDSVYSYVYNGLTFKPKGNKGPKNWAYLVDKPFQDDDPLVFQCEPIKVSGKYANLWEPEGLGTFWGSNPLDWKGKYKTYFNSDLVNLLKAHFCSSSKVVDSSTKEYNSKTHWVKNEAAWQTLLKKLQWMSNEYFGGGKITITEFWVAVDQVKFHKLKELGSFAEANCGAKANPASGGQYDGEDLFSFKLKGTNIDAPITDFVTFYIRCEKGNKAETLGTGNKPETQTKTQTQTQTKPKTTQTKPKTTQTKPKVTFTECSNTYSYGCRSEKIEEAQKCLKDQGLYSYTVDGKFGSKTLKSIKSKLNKTYFTDSDITAICGRKQEEKPLDSESTPGGGSKKEEDYVWNGIMI